MSFIPRFMWSIGHACTVEVVGCGHFPSSCMIKLPSGLIVEAEIADLSVLLVSSVLQAK